LFGVIKDIKFSKEQMIKEQVDTFKHKMEEVRINKLLLHRVEEECSEACLVVVNRPYNNNHKVVVFNQLLNH
jgi:hypothetical protein